MLQKMYKKNLFENKFVVELNNVIRKQHNTKFKYEIDNILNNRLSGKNVINDIKKIFNETEKKDINYFLKKVYLLLSNRNLKKITIIMIMCSIVLCSNTVAYAAESGQDIQVFMQADEFNQVQMFIRYLIMTIRGLVVSVCGLIAANSGLKLVTDDNLDGAREAKKSFQKIIWALFLAFAGTGIASLLARKLLFG